MPPLPIRWAALALGAVLVLSALVGTPPHFWLAGVILGGIGAAAVWIGLAEEATNPDNNLTLKAVVVAVVTFTVFVSLWRGTFWLGAKWNESIFAGLALALFVPAIAIVLGRVTTQIETAKWLVVGCGATLVLVVLGDLDPLVTDWRWAAVWVVLTALAALLANKLQEGDTSPSPGR